MPTAPLEQRFWSHVDKGEPEMCWNWTGSKANGGYGIIYRSMKLGRVRANRLSWELANGPIPAGLYVCHKCDNPSCVNPAHLFLGTQKANIHDCIEKERNSQPPHMIGDAHHMRKHPELVKYGEDSFNAKLTQSQVDEIRAAYAGGTMLKVLAPKYGVHPDTLSRIIRGATWRNK